MEDKIVIFTISIILVIISGIVDVNAHKLDNLKMGKGSNNKENVYAQNVVKISFKDINSMKIVNELCGKTTYKDSCFKSLRSLARKSGNNPQELFKSGVKLALRKTKKASKIPTTLIPKANSKKEISAIESCKDLLEQSVDRLRMASHQVGGNLSIILKDPVTILNIRLELGDVDTFSTNCMDELEEAGAPQLQQLMKDDINNAKELSVNLLDIISTYNF